MEPLQASRTAVLVCQGRALAHARMAPGHFDDPSAMSLLTEPERAQVEAALSGVTPRAFAERIEFERLTAIADVMVPRTIAIDTAIRLRALPQLVILGAGLDGRAWRMGELVDTDVFEVDHPRSQDDKQTRVGQLDLVARSIRFVPADLTTDSLDAALDAAGHRRTVPTTWVCEGVIPYLVAADVETMMRAVARRSAPGSRLVVNYQARALTSTVGRVVAAVLARMARSRNPMAAEPWRSWWTPESMRHLLARNGFTVVDDDDLLTLASRLSLAVRSRRYLQHGRVAVADR